MKLFEELKRRNVFRVAVAYAVASWVLLQVADLVLEAVEAPGWVLKVMLLVVSLGFVVSLIVAWAYELTPEGIKREKDVDRSTSVVADTGRKLDRIIIFFLAFAVVLLLADRFLRPPAETGSGSSRKDVSAETSSIPKAADKSIAVLPFADLSQAGDQEWFADGLAEEILNALVKTPDLQVASRTSTFRYKGSTLDIPEIAAELGVAHVLEGSVRSAGDRIRVTAQLIRAEDGFHVWSENYDRTEADMIGIQEDLAVKIAKALETTMDPEALAAMANAGTRSITAYEEYLRGLTVQSAAGADALDFSSYLDAYEHFENARSIDPNFAQAHLQAAEFWRVQLTPSRTDSGLTDLEPREMLAAFNERIELAIASAPSDTDAKGYRALKALVEMRLGDSIRLFSEYLDARPNDELTRGALVDAARIAADQATAMRALSHWREQALSNIDAALGYANLGYRVVDPVEAAAFMQQVVDRWPNHAVLIYQAHRTALWAMRLDEAKHLANRFRQLAPERNVILEARQACAEGRRDDAVRIYESLDPTSRILSSERWHLLKLLGEDRQADEVLRIYEQTGIPYQLADMLTYPQFDPAPYPSLLAILQRQGVQRPPPRELPFKCPPPEQTSIAVLPFVNMSTDVENEFFSDGIAEEILNVLASIPELKVAARTSAFAYKGTNTNISNIANELGVNHILEGSVRKAGNQVRVTAQLIQASDGFHLWSDNYDRELTNIFAIQDEIAGSIADALKVTLKLEAGESGNLTGTTSIEAYEHYLRGMQHWHLRTVADLEQAIEEFNAAIALDPDFAKAHAGLALAWGVISGYTDKYEGVEDENALAAARRALELDPDNVEAKATIGVIYRYGHSRAESRKFFEEAIATNPSFATAHQWYGGLLGEMGDPEAGLAEYRKAWSLDPRSRIIGYNLAYRLWGLGHVDEAWQVIGEVIEFAPNFPDALGLALTFGLVAGQCDRVADYANRLIAVLKKPASSKQLYLEMCQSEDPERRRAAEETILSWDRYAFADADHPTLSYTADLQVIFVERGNFDAFWNIAEKEANGIWTMTWMRIFKTDNAIRLQCSDRYQMALKQYEIPPAIKPVSCL